MYQDDQTVSIIVSFGHDDAGAIDRVFALQINGKKPFSALHAVSANPRDQVPLLSGVSDLFGVKPYRLVGFDTRKRTVMPFVHACLANNVPFPWYYRDRFGPRYRYSDENLLDLKDLVTDYGAVSKSLTLNETINSFTSLSVGDMNYIEEVLALAFLLFKVDVLIGKITPSKGQEYASMLRSGLMPNGNPTDSLGIRQLGAHYEEVASAYGNILTALLGNPSAEVVF